jgi:dienelactone hydrolase
VVVSRRPGLGLLACVACTSPVEEVAFCDSSLRQVYEPEVALTSWPDDHWTVPDPTRHTGVRLEADPDAPAFATFPDLYRGSIEDLRAVDGFATSASLFLTADGALPEDPDVLDIALLSRASDGTWERHDHSRWTSLDRRTLFVQPWRPLPPARQAVLAVRAAPSDGSRCVSPSPLLRAHLTGPSPRHDAHLAALGGLGWSPGEVGAMTLFTTQSAGLDDAEVLADIGAASLRLDGPMSCEAGSERVTCDGTVTVGDYRDPTTGVVPAGEPLVVRQTYALPVSLWLPPDDGAGAPYPVAVCGHGLGGTRQYCRGIATRAAALGVATLAVDAVEHGDHPLRSSADDLISATLGLTGIQLDPPEVAPLVMRDNLRQSAWDKLQVLRAVQAGWDADGDGTADLDGDRVLYVGVSLGGIMAPQFLALAPEVELAALATPGGGLMDLFVDSDTLAVIARPLIPEDWTDDDVARALPMLQALADAADPLVFAAALARQRQTTREAHVAMLLAVDDSIVPNTATTRLTRALGVPTVGPALLDIPGVATVPGPARGNLDDGATGALLQFDEVQREDGAPWTLATHTSVPESVHWDVLVDTFARALVSGETPEAAYPAR